MRPSQILASCAIALASAPSCTAAPLNETIGLGHFDLTQALSSNITLATAENPVAIPFWNCKGFEEANAGLVVQEIALSPNPPVRGQDLDIVIKGNLHQQMDAGAYVKISIIKFGFILAKLKYDWCNHVQGLVCPVQPGNVTILKTQFINDNIPTLKFALLVETFNQAGDKVSCLSLRTKVTKPTVHGH